MWDCCTACSRLAKPGAVITYHICLHDELYSKATLFDGFTVQAFPDDTDVEMCSMFVAICGKAVCQERNLHRFPGTGAPPAKELQAGRI